MEMTWDIWKNLPKHEQEKRRDLSGLSPQLTEWKGWRVEVVTTYGETRRFIVGQSAGWRPCSLEIARRDSSGGGCADREYASVRPLYKVR